MEVKLVNIYKESVSRYQTDTFREIINDGKLLFTYNGEVNSLLDYTAYVVNASPMGSACLDVLKTYIAGEGIVKNEFEKTKVNQQGETFAKLHKNLANDMAFANRFCVLITWEWDFEAKELKPKSFEHLPIEWVRFSIPDKKNEVRTIKYNPYYNKPEELKEQSEYFIYENIKLSKKRAYQCLAKSENLKEVYFFCEGNEVNRVYTYPKYFLAGESLFLTDTSAWHYHQKNIQNNFFLGGIMQVQGRPDHEITDEYGKVRKTSELLEEKLKNIFAGDGNAGSILVLWKTNEDESDVKYEPIQSNDNDDKMLGIMELCRSYIPTIMGVSPLLAGVEIAGKLGDSKEKEGAVKFQNDKTKGFREAIENFYFEFMPIFFENSAQNDFKIQKIQEQTEIPDFIWQSLTFEQKQEYIKKNYPNLIQI